MATVAYNCLSCLNRITTIEEESTNMHQKGVYFWLHFYIVSADAQEELIGNKVRHALGDGLCLYESFPHIWLNKLAF